MFEAGEVTRAELLNDLTLAQDYFTARVSKEYGMQAYRKLSATHYLRDVADAEKAYVYALFGQDCEDEGISVAALDWAIAQWRRGDNAFAPTFGQILAIVQDRACPSWRGYQDRIQSVIDPRYSEKVAQMPTGIRTQPKAFVHKTTAEERAAQVGKWGKPIVKNPIKERSEADMEKKRMASIARRHIHAKDVRVRMVEERGSVYFSVDILEEVLEGEPKWSSIRRFIRVRDAHDYLGALAKQKETA